MANFLEFIEEDISAKKQLVGTLPTRTKLNKTKFNDKIEEMSKKYSTYKTNVKKYIDTKSKSFNIKPTNKNIEELTNKVTNLERIKFILNPYNDYFEKMGFDNLLYEMGNYTTLDFNSLYKIIFDLIEKFKLAEIKLNEEDFKYNCYVYDYMSTFLKENCIKSEAVEKKFEEIYWLDSNIINDIELNFRFLILDNKKKFVDYINDLKKNTKKENEIQSYEDCLNKLKAAYTEFQNASKEDVVDIIEMAKKGDIDINQYFEGSKIRTTTYAEMMIENIDLNNKEIMEDFYDDLDKLRTNIDEYAKYVQFIPLINFFKAEYEKELSTLTKDVDKKLKSFEQNIDKKEKELFKLNNKIFKDKNWKNQDVLKDIKFKALHSTRELYTLYQEYDKELFHSKVINILDPSLTIDGLLHLYYSFDSFKKQVIKQVFNLNVATEINKFSDDFDLFAMNPNNVIINGIEIFQDTRVAQVITNKYRLSNINITEEALNPDDLNLLTDKIDLLLRINKIESSSTTIEKIWFMSQVEKINVAEKKKMEAIEQATK